MILHLLTVINIFFLVICHIAVLQVGEGYAKRGNVCCLNF